MAFPQAFKLLTQGAYEVCQSPWFEKAEEPLTAQTTFSFHFHIIDLIYSNYKMNVLHK